MTVVQTYDAVVIGAGHNGLVCAGYLAKAGLKTLVVERRDVVGGAAVTEEIAPGFKASTASYSLSLFRPDIYRDLELGRHGLVIVPKDPQMFVPLPDGRHFFVWRDQSRTVEELGRISPHDAGAYPAWNDFWDRAVRLLRPVLEDPDPPSLEELKESLRSSGNENAWNLAVAGSVADTVSTFFDDDSIRGAFASQGIIGTNAGPYDPGTAWVMAYHYLGGELCGSDGTWAYVVGGMGALTQALRKAAEESRVEVRTGCEVKEVLIESGRAVGVRTAAGQIIRSSIVTSNATPKRTFENLVPDGDLPKEFAKRVSAWRSDGCVVKVNLALNALPDFAAVPGTIPGPQHSGTIEISPSLAYLDAAYQDARKGLYSSNPFMEVYLQSAVDPSLADDGHVLSAFTQYAPTVSSDDWRAMKPAVEKTIVETLASYAPNVSDAIVAAEVLGPHELEDRFGLTGGDIFHGSILPDQCFAGRFDYRTPIPGLYLCGSGARPGGGVMGAPGRNAALAVLSDFKSFQNL